jgi:hypothetical protein
MRRCTKTQTQRLLLALLVLLVLPVPVLVVGPQSALSAPLMACRWASTCASNGSGR